MFYTEGKDGVEILTNGLSMHLDVPQIEPVSTIGAGDNFNAGVLYSLLKKNISLNELSHLSQSSWQEAGRNGIAFSSNVCLHYENYISDEFAAGILGS